MQLLVNKVAFTLKGDKNIPSRIPLLEKAGTVFKNNSGSTVLTAHVYKAGVEQSITDAGVCGQLGSVKWYKQGTTTAISTSKTLTINASDVVNVQAYTCQLEG